MPARGCTELSVVPGVSCASAASALTIAGLGQVCRAASAATGSVAGSVAAGVTSVAGSAVSKVAGFGVDSVLSALGSWVSDGATWLLTQIGSVIGSTTTVDLSAPWFSSHYATMAALAGVVILPLALLGIVQSIYRQSASTMVRSVVVNVPLAILLTAVAVKLVELGLAVTDAMSQAVAASAGLDAGHFLGSVTAGLSGVTAAGQPAVPPFVLFLGSLAVVFGAVMVWIELLIRSAAVYVTVLFLPLALASLAWPAIAHWCRRLVDTLVALILGKFVIVAVLSLAAGALAGSETSGGGGFTAVLGGAALLLLAGVAPWALFRLLPFLEAGAVGHLEGVSQRARHTVSVPAKGLAQVAMRAAAAGSLGGAAGAAASGSLLGSSAGGAAAGIGAGTGGGPGPAGGSDPAGGGPAGLGPSSAELTGVGTTRPPGQGIPAYPAHPRATATFRRMMAEADAADLPVGSPGPSGAPDLSGSVGAASTPSTGSLVLLPRQTGTTRSEWLGRDELGPKLIANLPPDPRPLGPPEGTGRGPGG